MTRIAISSSGSVWFSSPNSATLSPNSSRHSLNTSRNLCNTLSLMIATISGETSVRLLGSNRVSPSAWNEPSPSRSFQTEVNTSFFENKCFSRKSFAPIRRLLSMRSISVDDFINRLDQILFWYRSNKWKYLQWTKENSERISLFFCALLTRIYLP